MTGKAETKRELALIYRNGIQGKRINAQFTFKPYSQIGNVTVEFYEKVSLEAEKDHPIGVAIYLNDELIMILSMEHLKIYSSVLKGDTITFSPSEPIFKSVRTEK
jgi:hypothetical protein